MNLRFSFKVNRLALSQEIARQLPAAVGGEVKKRLFTEFEKIKKQFLAEFSRHAITMELQGGAHSSNISGTLGGYGNLYSFLGFDERDPTAKILELINKIKFTFMNFNSRKIASGFVRDFPTEYDIAAATPVPWAPGLSWAQGIHNGHIPNFGHYMNKDFKKSRSGGGLQVDTEIPGRVFRGDNSYIMGMLIKYKGLFEGVQI